jgi:hypothetical protein
MFQYQAATVEPFIYFQFWLNSIDLSVSWKRELNYIFTLGSR